MKNLLILLVCGLVLTACGEQKWEYKVMKVAGQESVGDYAPMTYGDQSGMLTKMGNEGWELVSTYTEVNTAFPNFGNSDYVTGIRTNTRTTVLNFVFKRKASKKK